MVMSDELIQWIQDAVNEGGVYADGEYLHYIAEDKLHYLPDRDMCYISSTAGK